MFPGLSSAFDPLCPFTFRTQQVANGFRNSTLRLRRMS